jgi:hypothetical protein
MKITENQIAALKTLKDFVGESQLRTMFHLAVNSDEAKFYAGKIAEVAATIKKMPKTYETDDQGSSAKITLHYFKGGCDWWIIEKDQEQDQLQAFGIASLGYEPEIGYINISEILRAGAELDLYWTPVTVSEIMDKKTALAA